MRKGQFEADDELIAAHGTDTHPGYALWRQADITKLIELVKEHKRDWDLVAQKLNNGLTAKQCVAKSRDIVYKMRRGEIEKDPEFESIFGVKFKFVTNYNNDIVNQEVIVGDDFADPEAEEGLLKVLKTFITAVKKHGKDYKAISEEIG